MKIISFCLLFFILLAVPSFGQDQRLSRGLSPQKNITQYAIDIWTNEDGLVSNTLNNVAQSQDGYIWVSSYNGIARFDGVSFKSYSKSNTNALESNSAEEFIDAGKDGFWVVFHEQGIISYQDNALHAFDSANTDLKKIESFFKDVTGNNPTIWIRNTDGDIFYRNKATNSIRAFPYSKINRMGVTCLATSRDGQISYWGTKKGLVKQENGQFEVFETVKGITKLLYDKEGTLWVGTEKGVYLFDGQSVEMLEACGEAEVFKLLEDDYGSIWIASSNGLFRQRKSVKGMELLNDQNGLWNKFVKDIFIDREGSLWGACYKGGLFRLKDGDFTNYTVRDGLSSNSVNGICKLNEQEYLIALDGGRLHRLNKQGEIQAYNLKTKFPTGTRFKNLYRDSKNVIWLSTYSGLLKLFPDGREVLLDESSGLPDNRIRVVLEDSKGFTWIGMRSGGVLKLKNDRVQQVFNTENGLGANYIMSLAELPDGSLAVGTLFDGLYIIKGNEVVKSYTEKDGLSSNRVFSIHVEENRMWLATTNALILVDGDQITNFTSKEGLCSDSPFDILVDDVGNFWLPTPEGICQVAKADLLAVANQEKENLTCRLLNKYDGMFVEEATGAVFSFKDERGRMWFPTIGGLASIHPNEMRKNDVPPPVHISGLIIDNQPIAFWKPIYDNDGLTLAPGTKRFNLQFTGLTFRFPEKTKFKYRLLGFEEEWSEVVNERQAIYTNLSPGNYTFQVFAANEDGIWSEESSSIQFQLAPFFYQSKWFWGLCVLLCMIGFYLVYQVRIRAIQKSNLLLQQLVEERTKEIADQKDHIETQHKELESAYHEIHEVSEMGKNVTASLDMDTILLTVYQNVNSLMDAHSFALGTYDENRKVLYFSGIDANDQSQIQYGTDYLKNEERLSSWCFLKGKPILINEPEKDVEQYEGLSREYVLNYPKQSFLYLPIISKGNKIGVITVQSNRKNAYTDRHVTILEALASYISTALDNASVYSLVADKNKQITDSIRYAQTIQQAVLPSFKEINDCFENFFVLFRPKDIVSGDFYWFTKQENAYYIAVMDCTGHGVPGAFMSLLGLNLLTDIVNVMYVEEPSEILAVLDQSIIELLHQREGQNADGMDASLCKLEYLPSGKVKVTYSGAKHALFYTDEGELKKLDGTVRSIGGFLRRQQSRSFTDQVIELADTESLYLSTDGFADQNGPDTKKIGVRAFTSLLKLATEQPVNQQEKVITDFLDVTQQGFEQRDDITVLGLNLKQKVEEGF